jgi:hypothetical protein
VHDLGRADTPLEQGSSRTTLRVGGRAWPETVPRGATGNVPLMPCPEVAALRRCYAPDVAANRLELAERWGRPCLAYNLIIRPDAAASHSVRAVQQLVLRREPALLAVPPEALHVSAAWLIPVHENRRVPKDEFWRLHGPSWLAAMSEMCVRLRAFRLSLHDVVATDAAIVAIAAAPAQVRLIRRGLASLPAIRGVSAGDMAHMTLFRYSAPLADPSGLLDELNGLEPDLQVQVTELQAVRESVFPALELQILRRFTLSAQSGPDIGI